MGMRVLQDREQNNAIVMKNGVNPAPRRTESEPTEQSLTRDHD